MVDRNELWYKLLRSEGKARASRLSRFLNNPLSYPFLLTYGYILYPTLKKDISAKVKTFFGKRMRTLLPSGTDVLLNGIKSHDSEIRLSKYFALALKEGDTFIDIGAHYGYYSLLASVLVGKEGKVYSIEPSTISYKLLRENTATEENITTYQSAAGNQNAPLTIYEYPGPYSEYNTTIPDAYVKEHWAKKIKPTISKISTIIMDEFISNQNIGHAIIKIDVEGGEPEVLKGMQMALDSKHLTIAMEFQYPKTFNSPHVEAANILYRVGYDSFGIQQDGNLIPVESIEIYMKNNHLESDNIVFRKSE
jgi:FkbM family methyltransferase